MIEPSGLVSRLMTFVLAGCLTVLVILAATLSNMFPLERTQVFFLTSRPDAEQVISIQKFDMTPENLNVYKDNFVKEYIVARNQITPSKTEMARKWRSDASGLVYAYSNIDVYADFMKTDLWNAILAGSYERIPFRCDVSFNKNMIPRKIDAEVEKYAVRFKYLCIDETTGQSIGKDFTIAISLAFQPSLKWNERLDNPLGLKVVGYEVEDGGEPLNTSWLMKAAGGRL
ncbi:MAG: type IV secretion system protein [Rickettsiales bacterium]|nr:type IV secretion system protein [Rickettsiales bacterium]